MTYFSREIHLFMINIAKIYSENQEILLSKLEYARSESLF